MSTPVPHPEAQPPRRGRPPTPGLREGILRAAETIFTRRDYHEVQMDDVAEACGVGKGTLYRYFPGKHALYFAVMFEGIERLRAELAAAVGTSEPAARKIRGIVRSEEHTSELQSLAYLVCRLLLEKKKIKHRYVS